MTDEPTYGRLLAIKAAAAGPYRLVGRCADCGEEEGVVAFQLPFSTSIAVCRRCRFVRTGIEDRRGMIQATATIALDDVDEEWARAERRARHLSGRADDQPIGRGLDVLIPKSVFARAIVPEAERSPSMEDPPMTIEEIRAEMDVLEKLDRELDAMIARAGRPEPRVEPEDPVEAIFAPWDDDVDDQKRD